jgi:hypothetical protein
MSGNTLAAQAADAWQQAGLYSGGNQGSMPGPGGERSVTYLAATAEDTAPLAGPVVCVISKQITGTAYMCNVYNSGFDSQSWGGTDVVTIPDTTVYDVLPEGTLLVAFPAKAVVLPVYQ